MTNDSDSFIQEVDESLRQDRLSTALKKWGPYALAAVVVLLAAIGGWQFWTNYQTSEARKESDLFAAALNQAAQGDLAGAKTQFEHLSNRGPGAYRLMARMEHAAIVEQQGDLQAAIREFDAIANDARDDTMKKSAQMRAAYLVADTQDFQAVQRRLQPLIDGGGQVGFLAQELLAVEAWEAGQNDLARDTLENLTLAFDAPESVRQRAQLTLAVLGPAPPAGQTGAAPAQNTNTTTTTTTPARAPAAGETK